MGNSTYSALGDLQGNGKARSLSGGLAGSAEENSGNESELHGE
jgi:hypothetical protein